MVSGTVQGEFVAALDAEVQRIKADEQQRKKYMTLAMYIEDEREESYADGFADGESKGRADGFADGESKGRAAGEQQRSRDIAGRMLDLGLPMNQIVTCTGLREEQIRALQ